MEENVNIQKLEEYAKRVRRKILKMIYAAGSGHPGGSLSCVEILVALYKEAMDITLDDNFKRKDKFILSLGRSNRDFDFLIETLKDTEYKVKIICDEFRTNIKYDNIEIINNVYGKKSWEYIKRCFCMVIPIKNPEISAGQTVLLNSMQLRKPIIITESKGLTDDYIESGKTGIIIKKKREELLKALNSLFENQEFYDEIADNEYELYKEKFSINVLGKLVGDIIKER